jgi:hypothetical protein
VTIIVVVVVVVVCMVLFGVLLEMAECFSALQAGI